MDDSTIGNGNIGSKYFAAIKNLFIKLPANPTNKDIRQKVVHFIIALSIFTVIIPAGMAIVWGIGLALNHKVSADPKNQSATKVNKYAAPRLTEGLADPAQIKMKFNELFNLVKNERKDVNVNGEIFAVYYNDSYRSISIEEKSGKSTFEIFENGKAYAWIPSTEKVSKNLSPKDLPFLNEISKHLTLSNPIANQNVQSSSPLNASQPTSFAQASPLQDKQKNLYQAIKDKLGPKHSDTISVNGTKIKYGVDRSGTVYIETFNKAGQPRRFDITQNFQGSIRDAHYDFQSKTFGHANFNRSINNDDERLLTWVFSKISSHAAASQPVSHTSSFSNTSSFRGVTKIQGTIVKKSDLQTPVSDYDWKKSYENKTHTQQFASKATNALIAHTGILSNYDRQPFDDLLLNGKFGSGEAVFQAAKFPPNHPQLSIVAKSTPDDARNAAQNYMENKKLYTLDPNLGKLWAKANKNLMVYVQLMKALEPGTGLKDVLTASGDDFIVEDTSKRHGKGKQEDKTWGDNGNGQGDNWLGWAQMTAREIINNNGGQLNQQIIADYFNQNVRDDLQIYYDAFNKIDPAPKQDKIRSF